MAANSKRQRHRAPDALYAEHKAFLVEAEVAKRAKDAAREAEARAKAAGTLEVITLINWRFYLQWRGIDDAKVRSRP